MSRDIRAIAQKPPRQSLTRRNVFSSAALVVGSGFLAGSPWQQQIESDPTGESLRKLATSIDFEIGSRYLPQTARHQEIMAREFNLATIDGGPLHWGGYGTLRPAPDRFNFSPPDGAVAFAEEHGMQVEGHHLVWGRQEALPGWLRNGGYAPNNLMDILRDHIQTVVGHYKGQIQRWSVVNEPFEEDGSYKTGPDRWGWWNDNSPWTDGIDPDYIEIAFREAHAADPEAILILNDHANEGLNPKSDALYFLAARLLEKGVPINGVGMQMHLPGPWGLPDRASVIANMTRFKHDLGLDVFVTEFDVNISPALGVIPGITEEERFAGQAWVYSEMLLACLESGSCRAFSVFGFWDPTSWLVDQFPDADALLFDEDWQVKPAYFALQEALAVFATNAVA